MKRIMMMVTAVGLLAGCVTARKPCQVERICHEHNADMRKMLDEYPAATMDLLKTIAELEQETGHYR